MAHRVETMAFANEVPWHGLGFNEKATASVAQWMKSSKTNWGVSKIPVTITLPKKGLTTVKGEFALVRDSDESVLSMVGATYKPVQNAEVFEFFRKFCEAGHMTMETAGSLSNGRYIWVLARVGNNFAIGPTKARDEIRPYLLIMSPHVFGKALTIQYTTVRVVCWNTLNMALGSGLKGDGTGYRMLHSKKWEFAKEEAEHALGLAMKQTAEFKEAAAFLATKKAAEKQVEDFFKDVLRVKADAKKAPVAINKFRAALEGAPGAQLVTAKGTWWGALNAVTYIADHANGSKRETALTNAWTGHQRGIKRRALKLALEAAI